MKTHFQEIDIGPGPFSMSADGSRVVDLLHPIRHESFAMTMKKPSGNIASSALLVFKPYKGQNQSCSVLIFFLEQTVYFLLISFQVVFGPCGFHQCS